MTGSQIPPSAAPIDPSYQEQIDDNAAAIAALQGKQIYSTAQRYQVDTITNNNLVALDLSDGEGTREYKMVNNSTTFEIDLLSVLLWGEGDSILFEFYGPYIVFDWSLVSGTPPDLDSAGAKFVRIRQSHNGLEFVP